MITSKGRLGEMTCSQSLVVLLHENCRPWTNADDRGVGAGLLAVDDARVGAAAPYVLRRFPQPVVPVADVVPHPDWWACRDGGPIADIRGPHTDAL